MLKPPEKGICFASPDAERGICMLNKTLNASKDIVMQGMKGKSPDAGRAAALDTLRVPAVKESLAEVLSFVDRHLEEAACPFGIQMQIDVAMEELFVNIACYAYVPESGDAELSIHFEGDPKETVITLSDTGRPFNPLEKTDPDITLSADEREIGGLGIFIVKKSMDTVEYRRENGKNILTIRKSFKKKKKEK